MPNKHTSDPIRFSDARVESEYFRADLEIIGLDHSGASFEGRVFADNPEAGENTPQSLKNGYMGRFHVFGHGGCFGEIDHCDVQPRRLFDSRKPHALTPITNTVEVIRRVACDAFWLPTRVLRADDPQGGRFLNRIRPLGWAAILLGSYLFRGFLAIPRAADRRRNVGLSDPL